jgi:hypothetical protein
MNAIATPTAVVAPKIVTIADTHYVFEYTVSCWGATSRDKKTSAEVEENKGAESGTASVNVHLLGKNPQLRAIRNIEQNIRKAITDSTPEFGRGSRLVPAIRMMEFKAQVLDKFEAQFNAAVDEFVAIYPSLVTSAYEKLGGLLDLSKFPKPSRIRSKFAFTYAFFPVPLNDFRVAPTMEAAAELNKFYESEIDRRLKGALDEAWVKLHKGLTWASETFGTDANGKGKKVFEASVEKFMGLTSLLSDFNLAGDHRLEAERQRLEALFAGRTAAALTVELKESPEARAELKSKVDTILSSLDFGDEEDDF